MLSKKYRCVKSLLTQVSKCNWVHRKLVLLSQIYIDLERGYRYSYNADENGENEFVGQVSRIFASQKVVFFDVGAHVGMYAKTLKESLSQYDGHLFELSEDTLDMCKRVHEGDEFLTLNHLALSNECGDVEYRFYPKAKMQNGISGVGPYKGLDFQLKHVSCTTGDKYCNERNVTRINLLKVDTEGYDLFVLKGFEEMLSKKNVDIIQFEYNIKSAETHTMLGDFYEFLEAQGYIIGVLRPEGVMFRDFDFTQNDFESGPNYVACLPEFKIKLQDFNTNIA